MAQDDDEIKTKVKTSKNGEKMTIELTGNGKLKIEAVILELEYMIHQFSKAEEELKKPGLEHH